MSFVAGQSVQLGTGFRATAGSAATTFQGWVETLPVVSSLTPSSGSGSAQTFTMAAAASPGNQVAEIYGLFQTAIMGANACYIRYNRGANQLFLADNGGTAWLGGVVPGSTGSVSNSQCTLSGTGASATVVGTQLTLSVPVTFTGAFAGAKNVYVSAYDQYHLYTGWLQMGSWTVPAGPAQYTLTTGVNPAGSGTITPGTGSYTVGTVVQVSAAAGSGYVFTGFSGDLSGTQSPQSLVMNGNKSVVANFGPAGGLAVSCSVSPTVIHVGQEVTYAATVTGGTATSYTWSGATTGSVRRSRSSQG